MICILFIQVTRLVKVKLGVGDVEIVIKNLSKCLDKDSVRVDGVGAASITEVSFQVSLHSLGLIHLVSADQFSKINKIGLWS